MFYQSWLDDPYLLLYLSSEQTGVGRGWVDLKENLSYSTNLKLVTGSFPCEIDLVNQLRQLH